jgi:hypothetical protein
MPSDPQGTIVTFDDLEPNTVVTFDDFPEAPQQQPAFQEAADARRRQRIIPDPTAAEFALPQQEFENPALLAAEPYIANEEKRLNAPIVIGEAPFKAQLGAAFGMPGSKPVQQMMPGYEFEVFQGEGPLKGKLLFRPEGGKGPWTTVESPTSTIRGAVSTGAGMTPATVLGGGGAAGGLMFSKVTGAPGAGVVLGAMGTAAGERIRQKIGESVFGLNPAGPNAPVPTDLTPEQVRSINTEVALSAAGTAVGALIGKTILMFRGAGRLPQFDEKTYTQLRSEIATKLEELLGPEEAKIAMSKMNAADIASATRSGGILQAQIDRLKTSGTVSGEQLAQLELEKEIYLRDLGNKLLSGAATREVSPTEVGEAVLKYAPEVPPGQGAAAGGGRAQVAALEAENKERFQRAGVRAMEDLTEGRTTPLPGATAQIGEEVRAVAPRGVEVTGTARVITPDTALPAVREAWVRESDALRARASEPFRALEARVANEAVEPTSLAEVASRYRDRLERRLFPRLSEEDQPVVNNFFARAFGEPAEEGAEGALLPRTYEALRDDVSNLKAAIRRTDKGFAAGDVRMLRDFVDAAEADIARLLQRSGGRELVGQYNAARTAFREAMDVIERSGASKFGARRPGGVDAVPDEKIATEIFRSPQASADASRMFQGEQNREVRETIKSTLLWELQRRAAPGEGGDVSVSALQNAIRDNETILANWFTPDEIRGLASRALEIRRVRRAMGVADDADMGNWFDTKFWSATPDRADEILNRIRSSSSGEEGARTIEMLRGMAKQKIYNEFVSYDEAGQKAFDGKKFFNDMNDPQRQQWYNAVLGPEFAARTRSYVDGLTEMATNFASTANNLRKTVTSQEAVEKNANRVAGMLRDSNRRQRAILGFSGDVPNPTKWLDNRWNETNAVNMKQIMSTVSDDEAEAIRNLTLNKIWREITTRRTGTMKESATARQATAIDENKLVELISDPGRKEWLVAVFGSPEAAYKKLDTLAYVTALLKPDQAKIILTQVTDPALISIEQLRRTRNVLLSPLSKQSRRWTGALEWASDRLRDRAAEALISPDKFLELQRAGRLTFPKAVGMSVGGQSAVQYFYPDDLNAAMSDIRNSFRE